MTLTPNQAAQVKLETTKARKDALRALYNRQNAEKKTPPAATKAPPRRARRQAAVARVPRSVAFRAFDGFDKHHLPVDELTAPYATTNFLSVMEFASAHDMDQIIVVCPRLRFVQQTYSGPMTDFIAMRYNAAQMVSASIATLDSLRCPIIGTPAQNVADQPSSVRARLHKQSVRLTCLGTSSGLYPPGDVYAGSVPMIENGSASEGAHESMNLKTAWADPGITSGYLRSVPAAAMIDKPLILDSAVAETVSYKAWRDMTVPASTIDSGSLSLSTALEPIVIYVPRAGASTTLVNYRLEVGQQWCSRHPHNVMLRATQKQHPATSPDVWHNAVSAARNVGEQLLGGAAAAAGAMAVTALTRRPAINAMPAIGLPFR